MQAHNVTTVMSAVAPRYAGTGSLKKVMYVGKTK